MIDAYDAVVYIAALRMHSIVGDKDINEVLLFFLERNEVLLFPSGGLSFITGSVCENSYFQVAVRISQLRFFIVDHDVCIVVIVVTCFDSLIRYFCLRCS
nr:hypothetical protein [Tanacetum cinerariifolium]